MPGVHTNCTQPRGRRHGVKKFRAAHVPRTEDPETTDFHFETCHQTLLTRPLRPGNAKRGERHQVSPQHTQRAPFGGCQPTRYPNKERRDPFHPTAGRLRLAPNEAEGSKQRKTNRVEENQQGRRTRAGLSGRSEGSKPRCFLRQILISPREDRTQCFPDTHPRGRGIREVYN